MGYAVLFSIYAEIQKYCPSRGWVEGLDEVCNEKQKNDRTLVACW